MSNASISNPCCATSDPKLHRYWRHPRHLARSPNGGQCRRGCPADPAQNCVQGRKYAHPSCGTRVRNPEHELRHGLHDIGYFQSHRKLLDGSLPTVRRRPPAGKYPPVIESIPTRSQRWWDSQNPRPQARSSWLLTAARRTGSRSASNQRLRFRHPTLRHDGCGVGKMVGANRSKPRTRSMSALPVSLGR